MQIFASTLRRFLLIALIGAGFSSRPALAEDKGGMPDLGQIEQTCLPTSTANLIVWFGHHGYPKLIMAGATDDERNLNTVHRIMDDTDARFDFGTRTDAIVYGIDKYIHDAGYSGDVEYRGMDWNQAKFPNVIRDTEGEKFMKDMKAPLPFSQDWLNENQDPNKGFILLLAYYKYNPTTNTYTNAFNAGHAVTLVRAEPDMLLIHDPAHYNDETGRKIVTPAVLTGGSFQLPGYLAPVSGLMLLTGSLLEAPPDSGVMLTGAVCIKMHPPGELVASSSTSVAAGPNTTMAGNAPAGPVSPSPASAPPATASRANGIAVWIFNMLFGK